MISTASAQLHIAIACGGTGGHLFPGLAVAAQLANHGAQVTLLVSNKEIDQLAAKTATEVNVVALPAVGLTRGGVLSFTRGFLQSYRKACRYFAEHPPQAVLAMGGFTSAPPILAAKRHRAAAFLHESNTVPGRANRWLSWIVERSFVGFPSASLRLHTKRTSITGTPVRARFRPLDSAACRSNLGLDPARPVALVMGGSQGAHGVNELVLASLPLLSKQGPNWQWVHLSGPADAPRVQQAYAANGLTARVHAFFADMEIAMGAATASVSRAGASSLAELAAMRLPSVLIPFPAATDNHQFHNARAFEQSGAARLLEQSHARPEDFAIVFNEVMRNGDARQKMQTALAGWDKPQAAEQIAQAMLESIGLRTELLESAPGQRPAEGKPERASRVLDSRASSRFKEPRTA